MSRHALKTLAPALAVLAAGFAGAALSGYGQYLAGLIVAKAVIGVALVLLVGYARIIMLATAAMLAIGAYLSAFLVKEAGLTYLLTLPLSLAAGALGGALLALPAARFRGHHLAMVTMVFQFLVIIGIREGGEATGGALGLRFPPVTFLSWQPRSDLAWLLLIAVVGAILVAGLCIVLQGRFGKLLRAMTDSEIGADAYGVDVRAFYVAAFAISAGALACVGALLGPRLRILDPESFGIGQSIMALAYPIVGGMSSVWGGLLGGTLLSLLPELLRGIGKYLELAVAALVVLIMLYRPQGLITLWPGKASEKAAWRGEAKPPPLPVTMLADARQGGSHTARPFRPDGVAAVEIRGLSKHYGALQAVDGVDLEIDANAIHGLIGPNGAGKTTLFNCVSGFIAPDAGTLSLFGEQAIGKPSRTRVGTGVTRTFQHVAVFRELNCLDNVLIGLGRNGIGRALAGSFAELFGAAAHRHEVDLSRQALSEVGLAGFDNVPAGTLSLGNQRRLEIARAIVSRPRLILLDEPVSGVSQEEEDALADLLLRLNREHGIAMLLIEHNIAFVQRLCHRVSVMAAGRLIASGAPGEVLERRDVQQIYFGSVDAYAA